MRTALIIFGVIFLVLGGVLYMYPTQNLSAQTSSANGVSTSSAMFSIPVEWSYASLGIGAVLLILGLVIPGSVKYVQGPRGPRGKRGPVHHYKRAAAHRRSRSSKVASVTTTTRMRR